MFILYSLELLGIVKLYVSGTFKSTKQWPISVLPCLELGSHFNTVSSLHCLEHLGAVNLYDSDTFKSTILW